MIEMKNVSKWYGPVQVLTGCSVSNRVNSSRFSLASLRLRSSASALPRP